MKSLVRTLGALLVAIGGFVVPANLPGVPAPTASAAPAGATKFTQIKPFRLVDTRSGGRTDDNKDAGIGMRAANSILQVQVGGRGGVPANATGVVLNVTVANPQAPGYVTVFPGNQGIPSTSNVNVERPGQVVANLVTVLVGQAYVNVYTYMASDIIVDVFGYYSPSGDTAAGRFIAYGPERILDTRPGGDAGWVQPGSTKVVPRPAYVPADASAVVVNLTVTNGYPGYWTAFAAGTTRPSTSNVNVDEANMTVPNQAIVPISAQGLAVYSEAGGHLLIDIAGWYTGATAPVSGDGLFVPIAPQRLLDTRTEPDPLGYSISLFHNWSLTVPIIGQPGIPGAVSGVALNLTATNSFGAGYVSSWPAGQPRPETSSLNLNGGGRTVAGHVIVRSGVPGVGLYSYGGTDLIADVFGWFTGTPAPLVTYEPVNDDRPAPIGFPAELSIDGIGLTTHVLEGVEGVDSYPGHLVESSYPNQPGSVSIFGHRVSNQHQFRDLDQVDVGSTVRLTYGDTQFVYRVTSVDITGPDDVSLYYSGSREQTINLIACHPKHSTKLRIVVRAELEGVQRV